MCVCVCVRVLRVCVFAFVVFVLLTLLPQGGKYLSPPEQMKSLISPVCVCVCVCACVDVYVYVFTYMCMYMCLCGYLCLAALWRHKQGTLDQPIWILFS